MGLDVVFFAVVAILLIWKLMNVINGKEQSFLAKTTDSYANTGENSKKNNGVLQVIGVNGKNKHSKESLDAILAFEKLQLDASLHNIYKAVFEVSPSITPSSTCQIAKQMYEEVVQAFHTKILASGYTIAPEMMTILNEKLLRLKHSVNLVKIESAKVVDISLVGKEVNFVVEIESQQILYREDETGSIVEGSKSTPVNVVEKLHIVRNVGNAETAILKAITL